MFELRLKTDVDTVAGPVENHWGKEKAKLQTTQSQSQSLRQYSHTQPKIDCTEQLTLQPENISTSHSSS